MGDADLALEPVFETVLRHAVRLCDADAGVVHRFDGGRFRFAHLVGGSPGYREYADRNPIEMDPGSLVGRVGLGPSRGPDPRRARGSRLPLAHRARARRVPDDPRRADARRRPARRRAHALARRPCEPFGDRTIDLLTTFAAQAAIAIRNVQLFQDMTRSVDELRALGEISQAVSSSLDLDEVLTTIVTRAVQLSGTEGGSMFEFDQATRLFHVRTCFGTEPELVAALRATRIHLDDTFVGRAAASGEPQSAPDLAAEPQDPHIELLARAGLAVDARRAAALGAGDHRRAARAPPRHRRLLRPDRRAARDAREPVGGRDPQRPRVPAARGEVGPARGRGPAQVGVPREHVARAAHAAQRGDRVLRRAAGAPVRRAQRAPGRVRARHPRLGPPSARADQRDPRPVQGRGRAGWSSIRAGWRSCPCSSTGWPWSGSAPTGRASRWSSPRTPASTPSGPTSSSSSRSSSTC